MGLTEIILAYGPLTSLLLSVLIIVSLFIQPRIWMKDLPKEVQTAIPPKTKLEKRQSIIVLILFLFILLVMPVKAMIAYGSPITLLEAWLITFSIYFIFNLVDLLVIDWLIVCTITPDFIRVKGVDLQVYKNYSKHLKDFFKGILLIAVFSFLFSLISYSILQYTCSYTR